MKKIKLNKPINSFDCSCLEGSISDVVLRLKEYEKEYTEDGFSELELKWDYGYESSEIVLFGKILESDSEYAFRKDKERKKYEELEKAKERRRKQYDKLKEEFGEE